MDKKYTVFGIICLIGAFWLMWAQGRHASEAARQAREQAGREVPAAVEPTAVEQTAPRPELDTPVPFAVDEPQPAEPAAIVVPEPEVPETLVVLENDYIEVTLTSRGAAVREVALKRYPVEQGGTEPYRMNAGVRRPALALFRETSDRGEEFLGGDWAVTRRSRTSAEFRRSFPGGLELVRTFAISNDTEGPRPYLIDGSIRLLNRGSSTTATGRWKIDVGTAEPTGQEGTTVGYDAYGEFLNFGYFDGNKARFHSINRFRASSGFLGMGARSARSVINGGDRVVWASTKNQFFVTVLTPAQPTQGWEARLEEFPGMKQGVAGFMLLDVPGIGPDSDWALDYSWYAGPKEYPRLSHLDHKQDLVLQFGWMSWISKMLLHLLLLLHGWVGNYGMAIVLMVVLIRVILWPLTAQAARSAKKMAAVQEPLKAIREKYKDQPERIQKETLKLFQEYKVNPVAGCFPLIIQIPIFFGLFGMLRTASELRFSSFLWVSDLSRPDTIAYLAGIPLNPLPLLMGATMFIQMRMTPTTMDKMQQRILQFMPILVTFLCYQFSSGLALYWTISNLFTILQQYLTNRQKDPVPVEVAAAKSPAAGPSATKKRKRKS